MYSATASLAPGTVALVKAHLLARPRDLALHQIIAQSEALTDAIST